MKIISQNKMIPDLHPRDERMGLLFWRSFLFIYVFGPQHFVYVCVNSAIEIRCIWFIYKSWNEGENVNSRPFFVDWNI